MSAQHPRAGAKRRAALRVLLLILRGLAVPVLCVAGLIAGLVIGYSYVGNQPVEEVFSLKTWKHLIDLIFAV